MMHKECKKMNNVMQYIITRKTPELKDVWEAQPIDKRLAWYRRHPGMNSDQLATALKATYQEILEVSAKRKFTYTGVPTDLVSLQKKYLPDRKDMFDRIVSNGSWKCPLTGADLYEDPSYEFKRENEEDKKKIRTREAEQISVVKAQKKKKGAKTQKKDFSAGEIDGAAAGEEGAQPKIKGPKKLGQGFLTKVEKLMDKFQAVMVDAKEEKRQCEAMRNKSKEVFLEELLEELLEAMETCGIAIQEMEVVRSEGVTDRAKPSDQYKEWVHHHDDMLEKIKLCFDYRAAKDRSAAKKARTH